MIEQRNIGVCLVLTIVTCGLYGLYWISRINDDSCELAGESSYTSGGMVVLFGIITCGLYTIYWNYKLGERLDSVRTRNGEPSGSLAILYLDVYKRQLLHHSSCETSSPPYINAPY